MVAGIYPFDHGEPLAEGGVRPTKNLLCTSVSLVVFRNHEEIRQFGASCGKLPPGLACSSASGLALPHGPAVPSV